jgi:hypothetical protein
MKQSKTIDDLGHELNTLLASEDPRLSADEIDQMLGLIDPKKAAPFDVALAATKALIQSKVS